MNSCNGIEMICALMFIMRNHNGIKCHDNVFQLETCNVMFKVISDTMPNWYDL